METCLFDEKRDIKRVVDGLQVDITDALSTGVVRDTTDVSDYNNIDNPNSVLGRVENVFDAIEAERAIKKYGKSVKSQTVAKEITTPPPTVTPSE